VKESTTAEALDAFERLLGEEVGGSPPEVLRDEPLSRRTTLQIGGPADALVEARTPEAVRGALAAARRADLPVFVLGGGSNLLVSDEGWRGVVVHVACDRVEFREDHAHVEAGKNFLEFILDCRDRSLTALEFASGVPGDIGGAIYGNAGCYGKSIGEFVIDGVVCDLEGRALTTVPAAFFEFDYRDSRLKRDPHVIVSARLRVEAGSLDLIQGEIDSRLEERRIKHPDWRREPTAGSYFKNLPAEQPGGHRVPAGKVLDHVHCRGLRVGDALVFPKHANIIVNAGHASAREVLTLAEVMRTRARGASGVVLEEEVMFVGRRPELLPHEELGSG
jgi:UDP-N-acetylmuramate dehydrogenase